MFFSYSEQGIQILLLKLFRDFLVSFEMTVALLDKTTKMNRHFNIKDNHKRGFTVMEIIIVIVVLGIIGAFAYPALDNILKDIKINQTINMVAQDIQYTREYSFSHRDSTWIEFDPVGNAYSIYGGESYSTRSLIEHPAEGGNFVVQLGQGDAVDVALTTTSFPGHILIFDHKGVPSNGGTVTINTSRTIIVYAETGKIVVN